MKILSQKREGNRVSLELEEDCSRFQKSYDKMLAQASKDVAVPGFRPGKAPRDKILKSLNLDAVAHHAAQDLVGELYPEVIETAKIDPVDYPDIEITQQEKDKPFLFKLAVEVYPEIKLGKYKGIKIEKKSVLVKEEDVLKVLGRLQERFAVTDADGKKQALALDDEFAKKVSRFGTLGELKEEILKTLQDEKKNESEADLKNKVVAEASNGAVVDIPTAMTEREIDSMLDELKSSLSQAGLTLSDYLKGARKEEKALRDEMRKSAQLRVRGKVVLKAIAEAENTRITPEEISAELRLMADSYGQEPVEFEKKASENVKKYVEEYLSRAKALDFLIEKASIKEEKADEK